MALNIITAKFCSGATQTWTEEAWQYDYGQVLQFDGLDLPEAYQVHFSNAPMSGTTITQIGGADGVTVPDQFFLTGETIYAWVFLHEGEDDGETVYMVTIPVKKRPQPSDDVPTPVEQSAIDQAIAALNIAVEKAEDAIEHYPTIIDGTWHVWDVDEEEYVDTGVEAQGEQGQPGQPGRDGTDGQDGRDGTDGQDGFSPIIIVTDITGGHRVTITDAAGTQTFDVMNGQPGTPGRDGTDGTDGYSPTVTVTEITGGHRVTITDAQGQHTFDVMDGSDASVTVDSALSTTSENPVQNKVITEELNSTKEDLSQKITSPQTAGTQGQVLTSDGQGGQSWQTPADCDVTDVRLSSNSVVNNGVANIVTSSAFGVYTDPNYPNQLRVYAAQSGDIKSPAYNNDCRHRPIVPYNQHESVFYGLAKAAYDTTQSQSSNAVGTYTEDAKSKISDMLNAPVSVSGITPSITAKSGVRYICGEVATLSITPSVSGDCEIMFESGSTPTVLTVPNTVKWSNGFDPTSLEADTVYDMIITDGIYGMVASWAV